MTQPNGRYRFQGSQPLDPDGGVHPEMVAADRAPAMAGAIPDSPQQLIAMQEPRRPEKPEHQQSPKVKEVLDRINSLETSDGEDLQIALAIVRHLERLHDEIVAEMKDDDEAKHSQIVAWAIDADRLYRARLLLESVDLN
ncbi:MAG: hypothetical protein VKK97_00405 [Synechococcaceae cyanobacterium]|nr:hypothetical protein [Synechococcaceae cyanobacterium]